MDSEIRVYDWSRPFGALANLTGLEQNRRRAAELAAHIAEFHAAHPDAPVDLVVYSGGGGLAILTAEALPESAPLRHLVLAQPAISPTYDLTGALRRVRGRLVNFYSPHDRLTLGWGTRTFGTIDRQYVESAGMVGFDLERAVPDPDLRHRVEQQPWTPAMARRGHWGGHVGILMYDWNRAYIAPRLLNAGR